MFASLLLVVNDVLEGACRTVAGTGCIVARAKLRAIMRLMPVMMLQLTLSRAEESENSELGSQGLSSIVLHMPVSVAA